MHPLQQVERASVKGIAKAMQDDSAHVNQISIIARSDPCGKTPHVMLLPAAMVQRRQSASLCGTPHLLKGGTLSKFGAAGFCSYSPLPLLPQSTMSQPAQKKLADDCIKNQFKDYGTNMIPAAIRAIGTDGAGQISTPAGRGWRHGALRVAYLCLI